MSERVVYVERYGLITTLASRITACCYRNMLDALPLGTLAVERNCQKLLRYSNIQ